MTGRGLVGASRGRRLGGAFGAGLVGAGYMGVQALRNIYKGYNSPIANQYRQQLNASDAELADILESLGTPGSAGGGGGGGSIPTAMIGKARRGGFYGRFNSRARMKVNCMLQEEEKFFDLVWNANNVSSSVPKYIVQNTIVNITKGDDQNQRIGSFIQVAGINIRGEAFSHTHGWMGCWLLLDTQANGTPFDVTKFLASPESPDSWQKLEYNKRWTVLKRWKWCFSGPVVVDPVSGIKNSQTVFCVDYYKKFEKPIQIAYEVGNSGGSINDIKQNNLLLVMNTVVPDPFSQTPEPFMGVSLKVRVRFCG